MNEVPTSKMDELIAESVSAEERAFLDELDQEPGYFKQAFGLFHGTTAWVNQLIVVMQALMALLGIWMAVQFFAATDPVSQLRWGLPAATILILSATLKLSLMPVMQANRVLRELRRLELVLSAQKHEQG